jgi:hypothetical protein
MPVSLAVAFTLAACANERRFYDLDRMHNCFDRTRLSVDDDALRFISGWFQDHRGAERSHGVVEVIAASGGGDTFLRNPGVGYVVVATRTSDFAANVAWSRGHTDPLPEARRVAAPNHEQAALYWQGEWTTAMQAILQRCLDEPQRQ